MKLLGDGNLDMDIVRALMRRLPELDLIMVQHIGLSSTSDEEILAYAVAEGRVVISQDTATMPLTAYERLNRGESFYGLIIVPQKMPIAQAIEELILVATCLREDEIKNRVLWLPL